MLRRAVSVSRSDRGGFGASPDAFRACFAKVLQMLAIKSGRATNHLRLNFFTNLGRHEPALRTRGSDRDVGYVLSEFGRAARGD